MRARENPPRSSVPDWNPIRTPPRASPAACTRPAPSPRPATPSSTSPSGPTRTNCSSARSAPPATSGPRTNGRCWCATAACSASTTTPAASPTPPPPRCPAPAAACSSCTTSFRGCWFRWYEDAELRRDVFLTAEDGVIVDQGARLPAERPFWRALDAGAPDVPLPFDPEEFGLALAAAHMFGRGIADRGKDGFLPLELPLRRFKFGRRDRSRTGDAR
nr:hypothetical protein [Actinomadura sp. CNU-125]